MLVVSSMVADKVSAYSIETGEKLWHYHADGPVRLAPLHHEGKLYFVSDDGYLYCLDSRSGEQIWKFQAAPNNRTVLGNERLISMIAAHGRLFVTTEEGRIYCFGPGERETIVHEQQPGPLEDLLENGFIVLN